MGADLYMAGLLEAQDRYPEVRRQNERLKKAIEALAAAGDRVAGAGSFEASAAWFEAKREALLVAAE